MAGKRMNTIVVKQTSIDYLPDSQTGVDVTHLPNGLGLIIASDTDLYVDYRADRSLPVDFYIKVLDGVTLTIVV